VIETPPKDELKNKLLDIGTDMHSLIENY